MKCKTLQIVWHGKEPVFTLDFCPNCVNTLATGGADKDIKVKTEPDGSPGIAYTCSLGQATNAVNTLRFSPLGDVMASGGDSGEVFLWKSTDATSQRAQLGQEGDDKAPTWKVSGALRGHAGDVHDLAWSPDGSALVTGSVENVALLWDVEARRGMGRLAHQHYVQGVAWDPLGHTVLTLSNDRTAKVYGSRPPLLGKKAAAAPPISSAAMIKDLVLVTTISKRNMADNNEAGGASAAAAPAVPVLPPPGSMPAPPARHPLFQDENLNSFFRRPSWSPDGSFLVVPAGLFKADASSPSCPTAYIFSRGEWSVPVAHLPSLGRPPVAVRFSPVMYRLRTGDANSSSSQQHAWEGLPYRMVWAIATLDSVMVYDTQCMEPLVFLGGLHMAPITDLAWSSDGLTLAVSSMDGYCSLAVFEPNELGAPMPLEELPPRVAACVSKVAAYRFAERTAKAKTSVAKPTAIGPAPATDAATIDPQTEALHRTLSGHKRTGEGASTGAPSKRMAQQHTTSTPGAGAGPTPTSRGAQPGTPYAVIDLDQDEDMMPEQEVQPMQAPAATPRQPAPQPAATTPGMVATTLANPNPQAAIPHPGTTTPAGTVTSSAPKRRIVPVPVAPPIPADCNSQGPFGMAGTPGRAAPVTFCASAALVNSTAEGTGATGGKPALSQSTPAVTPVAHRATAHTTVEQAAPVVSEGPKTKKRIVPVPIGASAAAAAGRVTPTCTGSASRPLPAAVAIEESPKVVAGSSSRAAVAVATDAVCTGTSQGTGTEPAPAQPVQVLAAPSARPRGMSLAMLAAQAGRKAASGASSGHGK